MALKPVTRRSVADDVFDQLFREILGGAVRPGSALPSERELTRILKVNRGALREALQRLAQLGLVALEHGSGNKVRDFRRSAGLNILGGLIFAEGRLNYDVTRSFLELRSSISADTARLAARRGGRDTVVRLDDIISDMEAKHDDLEALQKLAMNFWEVLIDAADNLAYRLMFNTLEEVYEPIRPALSSVMEPELHDINAYRSIATAVAIHDEIAARAHAQALMDKGMTAVTHAMSELVNASTGLGPESVGIASESEAAVELQAEAEKVVRLQK